MCTSTRRPRWHFQLERARSSLSSHRTGLGMTPLRSPCKTPIRSLPSSGSGFQLGRTTNSSLTHHYRQIPGRPQSSKATSHSRQSTLPQTPSFPSRYPVSKLAGRNHIRILSRTLSSSHAAQ
ncbi:hypothetical protein M3J09_013353 [Ascochyta lentis]